MYFLAGVGLSAVFAELAMQYAREGISPWGVPVLVGTFVGMIAVILAVAVLASTLCSFRNSGRMQ